MSKVYSILSNSNVNCPGNFLDIKKDILNWHEQGLFNTQQS